MYRHLLVLVDGSDDGVGAIGHAVELAQSLGARITFLHVPTTPDVRGPREVRLSTNCSTWSSMSRQAVGRLQGSNRRSSRTRFIWEHMGREEGVILQAARRHLTDADWREIDAAWESAASHDSFAAHTSTTSGPDGSRG